MSASVLAIVGPSVVNGQEATKQEEKKLTPLQEAELCYRKGQAAEKKYDVEGARAAYAKAVQLNPNHANALYALGQLKINGAAIVNKGIQAKFNQVMVPEFKTDDATLQESLDALQKIVEKESKNEIAPNFIIQDTGGKLNASRVTLNLRQAPAGAVMKYVLEQAGAKSKFDGHAYVISPQ